METYGKELSPIEKGRAAFEAWPADLAMEGARIAAEAWEREKEWRLDRKGIPCQICTSPARRFYDELILTNVPARKIARRVSLTCRQNTIKYHRDKHLLPTLNARMTEPEMALRVPYPVEPFPDRLLTWYLRQYYGVRTHVLLGKNPNPAVGIRCLDRMLELEVKLGRLPAGPLGALPAPNHADVLDLPEETHQKLKDANERRNAD